MCVWRYLKLEFLDLLPSEVRVFASKVTVGGGLAENWALELEVTLDASGAEVEVLGDDIGELSIGHALLDSSVGVNKDGERVRNTNGVRKLNKGSSAELGSNEGLGDPTSGVGGRTVDLGGVLSGESSTSVGSPSTVGVNDDLTSSKTSISVRSSNNESARGVQVVDGLVVEELLGDDRLDDVLHEILGDLFVGDILGVLGGDDNGVDTLGDWDTIDQLVFAGDLGLSVGTDPLAGSVLTDLGELGSKAGGQVVGERHESLGLIGGVSKHDTLVTGSNVLDIDGIDRLGNIGGLLLDGDNDVARLVVESLGRIIVSNVLDGITNDLLVVDRSGGGDLSEDHDHAGLAAGLAGNTRVLVSGDASVQDGIRDLVTELICN